MIFLQGHFKLSTLVPQQARLGTNRDTQISSLPWNFEHGDKRGALNKYWDFPDGSMLKNPPGNAGDTGSTPELGRSPGEGNGNPL